MEMGNRFRLVYLVEVSETFNNASGSIAEHNVVLVILSHVHRVDGIGLPELEKESPFLIVERMEIDKYNLRFARHIPSTHTHLQAFSGSAFNPIGIKFWVFFKQRRVPDMKIRSDVKKVLTIYLLQ